MANELLDFVMAVVGDPATAARYAHDPAGALADAQLGDVTTADVDNLIPLVTESFASALPGAGGAADSNVWASGAATAAFDAFGFGDGLDGGPGGGFGDLPNGFGDSDLGGAAGTVITPPGIDTADTADIADIADIPGAAELLVATPEQVSDSPYGDALVDAGDSSNAGDDEAPWLHDRPADDATGPAAHPVDPTFDLF